MAKQILIALAIAVCCVSMISAQNNAAESDALLGVADLTSPTVTLGDNLENSQITGLALAVSPPCLSVSTGEVGVLFKKAAKGLKPKKCTQGTNCYQFVPCKSPTGQLNCYQPVSCKATDKTKCRVLRPCTSTDCNGQFKFVSDVAGFKFKSNPVSGALEIRKCPTGCVDIKRCTSTVFAPNPDCYDFQPCTSTTGAPSCLRIVECQEAATSTTPFVSTTTAPVVTTTTPPVVTTAPCNPKIQVVKSNSGYSLVDGNNNNGVRFQQCATGSPCGEYINCPAGTNCPVKREGCKSSTLSCLQDVPCCPNAFQLDPVNNGITLVKVEVDGLTTVPCPGNDKCFQLRDCKVSKDPATGAIIPCLAKRDCTSDNKSCFQLNPCAL